MAGDETKDMERIPLYQTEAAKKAVRERGEHLMRAIDYIARYINRDKTEPNIIETKDNLLELENSMKTKIPEELVYDAFINMANTAQKTWENEKRSVHEIPAVPEVKEPQKIKATIKGVGKITATPIRDAKKKRESSI